MLNNDNRLNPLERDLDKSRSVVQSLQKRVLSLEADAHRSFLEFLAYRNWLERELNLNDATQWHQQLTARELALQVDTAPCETVEVDAESISSTLPGSPGSTLPCLEVPYPPFLSVTSSNTPPLKSLVKIIAGNNYTRYR